MKTEKILLARVIQLLRNSCGGYSEFQPDEDNPSYYIHKLSRTKVYEYQIEKLILSYELSEKDFTKLLNLCVSESKLQKILNSYISKDFLESTLTNINLHRLTDKELKYFAGDNVQEILSKLPKQIVFKNKYDERENYENIELLITVILQEFDLEISRINYLESLLKVLLRLTFKNALKVAKSMLADNNSDTKKLTDKQIAEVLNITPSSFSEYMTAKSLPELENLVKLSKYIEMQLGTDNSISYDFLLGKIQKPSHDFDALYNDFGLTEESYKILQIAKSVPTVDYNFISNTLNFLIGSLFVATPVIKGMHNYIDIEEEEKLLEELEFKANLIEKDSSITLQYSNGYEFKQKDGVRIIYNKQYKLIKASNIAIRKSNKGTISKINGVTITKQDNGITIEKNGIKNHCSIGETYRTATIGYEDMDVLSAVGRFLQFESKSTLYTLFQNDYDYLKMDLSTSETSEEVSDAVQGFFEELYSSQGAVDMYSIRLLDVQRRLEAYRTYLTNRKDTTT